MGSHHVLVQVCSTGRATDRGQRRAPEALHRCDAVTVAMRGRGQEEGLLWDDRLQRNILRGGARAGARGEGLTGRGRTSVHLGSGRDCHCGDRPNGRGLCSSLRSERRSELLHVSVCTWSSALSELAERRRVQLKTSAKPRPEHDQDQDRDHQEEQDQESRTDRGRV